MTLRVFEAFAGIGTQSMALKRAGINFKVVGIAEIDPNALISYAAIHHSEKVRDGVDEVSYEEMYHHLASKNVGYDYKSKNVKLPKNYNKLREIYVADIVSSNYGDVTLLNPHELPDMDLFTYSFPCQDLSVSGAQKGMGEGTRSGLLYECEKIIQVKKPKYTMLENVKNLVGKKFKPDFDKWLEWLKSQKYKSYWKVLNAKDYKVPQNRERVFAISLLEDKDYEFPDPLPLDIKLKDILEEEIDEKYFLNYKFNMQKSTEGNLIQVGTIDIKDHDQIKRVYSPNGLSPTMPTCQGGNQHPKIIEYNEGTAEQKETTIVAMRGRYNADGMIEQKFEPRKDNLTNTITTVTKDNLVTESPEYRIRRLTPLECWKLMGIDSDDFFKAKSAGISDSQLYKQSGNAIVVNVLEAIFKNIPF